MALKKSTFDEKIAPAREPRFRERSQKIVTIEATSLSNNDRPTVSISEITSIKNQIKIVMLITKYSSKIHKPTLYNKIINNLIYEKRLQEVIEERVYNLENYQP